MKHLGTNDDDTDLVTQQEFTQAPVGDNPTITVSATPPENPQIGDLWVQLPE